MRLHCCSSWEREGELAGWEEITPIFQSILLASNWESFFQQVQQASKQASDHASNTVNTKQTTDSVYILSSSSNIHKNFRITTQLTLKCYFDNTTKYYHCFCDKLLNELERAVRWLRVQNRKNTAKKVYYWLTGRRHSNIMYINSSANQFSFLIRYSKSSIIGMTWSKKSSPIIEIPIIDLLLSQE